ncbi:MAG TPA: Lrp/AsnC ligand binding domain-containing protein [Candidatus Thermoplasmatota archaeon]|nr:Lrp/AsnC ligand binding domain-containing protein [Candidatus Thermoplasmatota archaeon]
MHLSELPGAIVLIVTKRFGSPPVDRSALVARISKVEHVREAFATVGEFDIVAHVVAPTAHDVVHAVEGIRRLHEVRSVETLAFPHTPRYEH